jgi:hypothetical protein
MLPSQLIELKIYKRIKNIGPKAPLNMGMLNEATGEDSGTIVERLKSLEADNRIYLSKWSGASVWPRKEFGTDDQTFFYTGMFLIEIVPQARKYFEQLEQELNVVPSKPLVFISCGQFSPDEINLGKKLAAAVSEFTGYEGYFAEDQNSLAGLSNQIFKALDRCAYFVAIMHQRGEVETLNSNKHIRGSIWIEQEIAIAAFLTATRKEIPVLLYLHKGIKREGLREQLKLNPIEFTSENEVLEDFIPRLKNGSIRLAGETSASSESVKSNTQTLRARGEELFSLLHKWLTLLAGHYLRRNAVMQEKMTYNQCLDMDIADGKTPFDFSRIELLINVDFPSARILFDQIIKERTNLNTIERAFKRSYEDGYPDGEKFLSTYIRTQQSIEELGERLQKHLLEQIRSMKS